MAVLTADVNMSTVGNVTIAPFSANGADTFYRGAIVYGDTGGGVQVVPAAGDYCIGISVSNQVTAAAGDIVDVMVDGLAWVPVGSAVAAADEGNLLIHDIGSVQTDNWADCESHGDVTLAANDIVIGRILRVTSTQMLIHIGPTTGLMYNATLAEFSYIVT